MNIKVFKYAISALVLLTSIISTSQAEQINKKESLMITKLSVVEDPVRSVYDSANPDPAASVWSFGRLMENMSGPHNVSDFVLNWLAHWETNQTINGFTSPARTQIRTLVTDPWLAASAANGAPAGTLDMSLAPFRLLAIVNRVDLRNTPSANSTSMSAGEGRFVFGVTRADGSQTQFTVILEYELPASTSAEVRKWAEDWSALSQITDPAAYNIALQNITDAFSGANTMPSKPNGNAINQVRTNEIALAFPWELREFIVNASTGHLSQNIVALTPDLSLNNTAQLEDFLNQNAAEILKERHSVPGNMLAASALVTGTWANTLSGVDDDVKQKFAVNTCNGCHQRETGIPFTHVFPRASGFESSLSTFLDGGSISDPRNPAITRSFDDLQRRVNDLNRLLHVKSDMDGDGKSDVIFRNMLNAETTVWLQNGFTHTTVSPAISVQPLSLRVIGTGDLNSDNISEMLLYDETTGSIKMWSLSQLVSLDTQTDLNNHLVGVGDLNGDTKADLVWFNSVTGDVSAWEMDGTIRVAIHNVGNQSITNAKPVAIADTNGDGLSEIIWKIPGVAPAPGNINIWEIENFIKTSSLHNIVALSSDWTVIDSDDFDRDGKADISWYNNTNGDITIWEMGQFEVINSHVLNSGFPSNTIPVATGDYNGDGSTDILWRNQATGDVIQWHMQDFTLSDSNTDSSVAEIFNRVVPFDGEITPPVIVNIGTANGGLDVGTGTLLGINGENFVPGKTSVIFTGGAKATFFNGTTGSETFLLVNVPEGAQSGPVMVLTPDGFTSSSQSLIVHPSPVITNIGTANGGLDVGAGTLVGINGENFIPGITTVTFTGGVQGEFFNNTTGSETFLLVVVPEGAQSGPVTVSHIFGSTVSEQSLTVHPSPTISNIGDANGNLNVSEGTLIGINGSHYIPNATTVTFSGGVQAEFFNNTVGTETFLLVIAPVGAQSGPVTVSTPFGSDISSQSLNILPPAG